MPNAYGARFNLSKVSGPHNRQMGSQPGRKKGHFKREAHFQGRGGKATEGLYKQEGNGFQEHRSQEAYGLGVWSLGLRNLEIRSLGFSVYRVL